MVEEFVPKRHYTEEFKTEATRLAMSMGQHRLGVPVATLGTWTRRQRNLKTASVDGALSVTTAKRPASEMEAEIARLPKGLGSAKLDIESLRKVTAYIAKESR